MGRLDGEVAAVTGGASGIDEASWSDILNVASVRSVVAAGGNLQHDTTKAAIAGLTRALAADHSPEGVRVNAVAPGPIFTPFHQRRLEAADESVAKYNERAAPTSPALCCSWTAA